MWQAQQSITWPGGGRSAKYAQGWWIVPAPPPRFSQDEDPNKKWFTAGFITYACHWLARGAAEWGDKTSWKECTCRSASGNRAKGNAHSQGSEGFQEKGGLRYQWAADPRGVADTFFVKKVSSIHGIPQWGNHSVESLRTNCVKFENG